MKPSILFGLWTLAVYSKPSKKSYGKEPACPSIEEKCQNNGNIYSLVDFGTPVCWSRVDDHWRCQPLLQPSLNCPDDFDNIYETCNFPEPIEPICPPKDGKCTSGGQSFNAIDIIDSKVPKCWKKENQGWGCTVSEGECPKNAKDINKCFTTPPSCPKTPEETCNFNSDISVRAGGPYPRNSVCWKKNSMNAWECRAKEGEPCDKTEIDITSCFNRPKCPKKSEACLFGDEAFKINKTGAPNCWRHTVLGWGCKFPKKGDKDCPVNTVDINECYPPKTPSCPSSYSDLCTLNNTSYIAGSPEDKVCWSKTNDGSWTCSAKSDVKTTCGRGEVDVSTCGVPSPPLPDCPSKYNEKCISAEGSDIAGEPGSNICWQLTKAGWKCSSKSKTSGKCDPGHLDITTCSPPAPLLPACPTDYFTQCTDDYNNFHVAGKTKGHLCWSQNNEGVWSCFGKNNSTNICDIGLLDISTCNLPPPNPPACPINIDQTCQSSGGQKSLAKLDSNVCWSVDNYGSWSCHPKAEGKKTCEPGELDILDCQSGNNDSLYKCPKEFNTLCKSGKGYKVFGKTSKTKCWKQLEDKSWSCVKPNGKGNQCENGLLDVLKCIKPDRPAPPINCPTAQEVYCKAENGYFKAGKPRNNICWSQDENGSWLCEGLNNSQKCNLGKFNVLKCHLPLPKAPVCPTRFTDHCKSGGKKILAGEPTINLCWSLGPFGEYICGPREENTKQCKAGSLDITNCELLPPPKLSCPKRSSKCIYQDSEYSIYGKDTPKCWSKFSKHWECEPLFGSKKDCPLTQLDITKCFPPLPNCPTRFTSSCKSQNGTFTAGMPGNNVCWIKDSEGNWVCSPRDYDTQYCDAGLLDVTTCDLPKPISPACPASYNQVAFAENSFVYASRPGANVCWSVLSEIRWAAKPRPGGNRACNPGDLDITSCNFVVPDPPSCPANYNSRCYIGDDVFMAGDSGDKVCWSSKGNKWSCGSKPPGSDECLINEVDVTKCDFKTPKTPFCPRNFYDSCKLKNNSSVSIFFGNIKKNLCWEENSTGEWECSEPSGELKGNSGKCNPGQLDISSCIMPKLPEVPCPTIQDTCSFNETEFSSLSNEAPSCWYKGLHNWKCINRQAPNEPDQGKGECPKGTIDKDICSLKPLPCPKPSDKCAKGYKTFLPTVNSPYPCWTQSEYSWDCIGAGIDDICSPGSTDIRTCYK